MITSVLFVHLGDKIPALLNMNIRRCKSLFPSVTLVLAGNSPNSKVLAEVEDVRFIELDASLGDPDKTQEKIRRSGYDLKFWDGYWQKTFDRLVAIGLAHSELGSEPILHIENDVILMKDFPFAEISASKKLMWAAHSDTSDIGSIIFSPSPSHSEWLAREVINTAAEDPSMNDMAALNLLRTRNSSHIELLSPTPEVSGVNPAGWVFDGLQYGDWLFGWDPNAHWGFKRRRLETTAFSAQVKKMKFEVVDGNLWVSQGNSQALVANLHIHSKEARFFGVDIAKELDWVIGQVKNERRFYGLDLGATGRWAMSRIRRWSASVLSVERWKALVNSSKTS